MNINIKTLVCRPFSLFVAAGMLFLLTACGPTAADVAQKIDNQETLDESDYRCMIDYLDDFADAQEAAGDNREELMKINQEYPHWMSFAFALVSAPDEIRRTEAFQKLESKLDKSETPE